MKNPVMGKGDFCALPKSKRVLTVFCLLALCATAAYAVPGSGSLKTGLEAGYSEIYNAMDAVKKIIYAVAAVIALIGAIKVYGKWSGGDPDTTKVAGLWFGGAAFLIVSGIIIDSLFLK